MAHRFRRRNIQNASVILAQTGLTWPLATRKPCGQVCTKTELYGASQLHIVLVSKLSTCILLSSTIGAFVFSRL